MVEAEVEPIARSTGAEIVVHPFENLLVDCAHDVGAKIILRGLRAGRRFRIRVSDGGDEPTSRRNASRRSS